MKRLLVALLLATIPAAAHEPKKSEAEAMMDFYIEQAKPVAAHQRLAELAGPWKITTRLWFDPSGEPQTASGTGSGRMILGGRFLQLDTAVGGAFAAETLTILGFDRRTDDYTLVGYDTLGTYYITAAGKYDPAQKAVVLHGSYAQPPSGNEQKYRFAWSTLSPREHLLTLYFTMGGKEVRVAETRFHRD